MSTLSIHPVEYLRLHLHYEEVRSGLRASLGSFVPKVCAAVEGAVTVAIVLLVAALVISVFMKLGAAGTLNADYCTGCELASTMFVAPQ